MLHDYSSRALHLKQNMSPRLRALLASRPILQSPMAGVQGAELAAAVHRTGKAVGAIPCALLSPEQILIEVDKFTNLVESNTTQHALGRAESRARSTAGDPKTMQVPINLNFFCHDDVRPTAAEMDDWRQLLKPYHDELASLSGDGNKQNTVVVPSRKPFGEEHLAILRRIRPEIVSFHFGLPPHDLLSSLRRDLPATLILSSATTVDEAQWLAEQGVDGIIAQGLEAGGHRGMFLTRDLATQTGTIALVSQIVQLGLGIPIIAAGGIGDPQSVRACRALGASGVQIGTVLLMATETKTSPEYRAALRDPKLSTTAVTNVFTGRPARAIVNRLVRELGPMNAKAPVFPFAAESVFPIRRMAESRKSFDFTSCWSGQNRSRFFRSPSREESATDIATEFARVWEAMGASLL